MKKTFKHRVLDQLYQLRNKAADQAKKENLKSFQLPEHEVADRNLAAGRSTELGRIVDDIDKIIGDVILMEE